MRVPELEGIIRRRILVNFRADPAAVRRLLPAPFRPKTHAGYSLVGICLIRLEAIRPAGWPAWCGLSSENAAHRIAVEWDEGAQRREGVFIPCRHTGSRLNRLAGGRIFPGEHRAARFHVKEHGPAISLRMESDDGATKVEAAGTEAAGLPDGSCFASLEESSAFFAAGSAGYSANQDGVRADGLELETDSWSVRALRMETVSSTFFADRGNFPEGSIAFDHALLMRGIPHRWKALRRLELGPLACCD
ncbi:MAG: DUF2071 domain-containing protein [Opitutales bacterium]|jgi:uncharacterized protein YqjF (DUF2071 family)